MRIRNLTLALALSLGMAASYLPAAAAAAPQPAWSLEAISFPTNLIPGTTGTSIVPPGYFVAATNAGEAPTAGPFTITDLVPAGLTPKSASGFYGTEQHVLSCSIASQTVTCSGAGPLQPDEVAQVMIAIKVPLSASGTLPNEASVSGGGATDTRSIVRPTTISAALPPFAMLEGESGAAFKVTQDDGSPSILAGQHPYELGVSLGFPTFASGNQLLATAGGVRDIEVVLPPGVVANPNATPVRCKESELEEPVSLTTGCPPESQVGLLVPTLSLGGTPSAAPNPLFNMVPTHGAPAEFAVEIIEGLYVHLQGALRSNGQYVLSASSNDILAKASIAGATTILWGSPSAESHDASRGVCLNSAFHLSSCPVPRLDTTLLTQPSACSGPLELGLAADSWIEPGVFDHRTAQSTDLDGGPVGIEGCSELEFEPSIALAPEVTAADSPTGLGVDLEVPQHEAFSERAVANLKGATVKLPRGYVINPSAANGRGACAPAQIGLESAAGQTPAAFSNDRPACPNDAKVGTVEVETPLLEKPLPGSVYLATPFANPFGTLLAIYIVVDDPETGIVLKLPGKVEADEATGQLTTTFSENPQLPFEHFRLSFFGGPRAALRTPVTCGTAQSQSTMTPWSGGAPALASNSFTVDRGANGAACAASADQLPNSPSFEAGTTIPLAGQFSPFVLHLNRADGSRELKALNVTMPPGLTGKLAGTPYCPEASLVAAAGKTGHEEQARPSCPAASQVGQVTVGAGAGSQPYYAQGRAYLAGPYNGAPLSLAIITPAVAGPFDLGTVVVRAALNVNLLTAQIAVQSDPLPTILKGVPLDIRSIAVEVGKPEFTLNPTSCEPMTLGGEAVPFIGQSALLSSPFQVGNCKKLSFKPKLSISLKGGTKRAGHPALKAVVTFPKKGDYANVTRAQVALPHSEFLDQGNLFNVCTQPELKSGTCPAKSIYGHAKAWTPLLDKPLEGPVYLGVGFGHSLPDLVAELNGQIRVLLHGRIDTDAEDGIRNSFEAVPDAPVSKFVLEMKGGKKRGLLENSEDICRKENKATVKFVAQNGRVSQGKASIATSCKGKSNRR